jgi:hypothetical protein
MRRFISRLLHRSEVDGADKDLGELTRLVRRFAVEQQQVPKALEDLVTMKYLSALPTPPPGHRFIVDRKKVEVRLERLGGEPKERAAAPAT